MLFAEPIDILGILPWVVVVIAVGVLAFIVAKCIKIYLTMKRNRTYVKKDGEVTPLLAIRGEYFVLGCGVEYLVGSDGQLKAGKYLLRGDGYDAFQLKLNGEEKQFASDDVVELKDGDRLCATTCPTLIKPYID